MRRKLSDEEMAVYRAPFPDAAVALAHLALSERDTDRGRARRCLRDDGTRACGARHLDLSEAPFLRRPWRARLPAYAEEFARKLNDCRLVKLGDGIHFLQEDHAETIGRSVAAFIADVEGRRGRECGVTLGAWMDARSPLVRKGVGVLSPPCASF